MLDFGLFVSWGYLTIECGSVVVGVLIRLALISCIACLIRKDLKHVH